ncbi:unnamed protein product [Prorocentrum cordatum]|uniref:Uncharacterized protein n=1 Tax=Prorocentrum cordatum TaxID=2364126 RepID=A0ABN9R206_9DINO|nr:unnamed protein product [Polarella glacialis]
MFPKQYPASLLGAVLTSWAGFAARRGFGPSPLAADAEGWSWRPARQLPPPHFCPRSTSTVVDCSCPAPVAPVPAAPQLLRVVGDGLTTTVEVPLAALAGAADAALLGEDRPRADRRGQGLRGVMAAPMPDAAPGLRILVQNEEDAGWTHERLLLWPSAADGSEWMVYTAGNDLYAEAWTDYRSAVTWAGRRRFPPGVRNVVTFDRPLLDAEMISLPRRVRGEVVLEHGSDAADWWTQDAVDWNGGRLAVPPATAFELSAAAILRGRRGLDRGADGEWVPIEYVTTEEIESRCGARIAAADRLRPARARLGDRLFPAGEVGGARAPPAEPAGTGAAAADSAGQEDFRSCWIDVDETGARFEEWRKVVQESTQEVFSDSSLRGPPACLEVRRKMCRHGGAPKIWFQERRKETGISARPSIPRGADAHRVNMGGLASLEVVARRLPQCTEAFARGADRANWAAVMHLAGTANPLDLALGAPLSFASRLSKQGRATAAAGQLRRLRKLAGRRPLEAARREGALEMAGAVAAAAAADAEAGGAAGLARRPPDDWCEGLSAAQRRWWLRDGNAACESLHYLLGGVHRDDRAPPSLISQPKMDPVPAHVQQRVFLAARRWIDVDGAVAEEGALAGLLKGKAGCVPLGSTSMGPYERSRASMPDGVVDAPSSATVLPAQARLYLEELATGMLLTPQEAALIREPDGLPGCHADPLLLQRPRSYGKFARRALAIGLVSLTRVDLLSGEGLGRIEMPILEEGELVWPMSRGLPARFSRSLCFAQAASQSRLDRQPSLGLRLSDRGPPLVLRGGEEPATGHFVYAGALGLAEAHVRSALLEARADFEKDHLKLHEVAGWQLEMVLGHMALIALVRREILSICHTVYAFVAQSYHAFSVLWPSAREELTCCLGIMVMLDSSWTRAWPPVVYSSDASLYGYGVAEASFDPETAAEVGRVSELSRRRLGAGLARQRAFECAGFLLDGETGEVVRDAGGAPRQLDAELRRALASERWGVDPGFPGVQGFSALLGARLVDYMNEEFLQGVKSWRGEKFMAGLMFFHPDYGRLGAASAAGPALPQGVEEAFAISLSEAFGVCDPGGHGIGAAPAGSASGGRDGDDHG